AEELHAQYRRVCATPDVGGGSLLEMAMITAGIDEATARAAQRAVAWEDQPLMLLPGALEALRSLRDAGFKLGVLANQPASALDDLRRLGVESPLDDIWLSDAVGLHQPDPAFFQLALDAWGLPAGRVAYVGDRRDNDIGPAKRLGLYTVRLRVGPHADQPASNAAQRADADAETLQAAAALLKRWRGAQPFG